MWSRREFNRRLDAHITGVNNPNAPFNQPDEHPMCEACPEEKYSSCNFPCNELEELEEKNNEARKQMEDDYESWLMEQEE